MRTKYLSRKGQLAFARDCKTIVTFKDVLDLLPKRFNVEDVQKALEELDVPYWPEEIQARFISSWAYYSTPIFFILHTEAIGLIRRVYDEDGLFIGFEKRR